MHRHCTYTHTCIHTYTQMLGLPPSHMIASAGAKSKVKSMFRKVCLECVINVCVCVCVWLHSYMCMCSEIVSAGALSKVNSQNHLNKGEIVVHTHIHTHLNTIQVNNQQALGLPCMNVQTNMHTHMYIQPTWTINRCWIRPTYIHISTYTYTHTQRQINGQTTQLSTPRMRKLPYVHTCTCIHNSGEQSMGAQVSHRQIRLYIFTHAHIHTCI